MPGGEHSLLQGSLGMVINGVIIPQKLGHAFIELHCTFGRSSLVPDISVFIWNRFTLFLNQQILNQQIKTK